MVSWVLSTAIFHASCSLPEASGCVFSSTLVSRDLMAAIVDVILPVVIQGIS